MSIIQKYEIIENTFTKLYIPKNVYINGKSNYEIVRFLLLGKYCLVWRNENIELNALTLYDFFIKNEKNMYVIPYDKLKILRKGNEKVNALNYEITKSSDIDKIIGMGNVTSLLHLIYLLNEKNKDISYLHPKVLFNSSSILQKLDIYIAFGIFTASLPFTIRMVKRINDEIPSIDVNVGVKSFIEMIKGGVEFYLNFFKIYMYNPKSYYTTIDSDIITEDTVERMCGADFSIPIFVHPKSTVLRSICDYNLNKLKMNANKFKRYNEVVADKCSDVSNYHEAKYGKCILGFDELKRALASVGLIEYGQLYEFFDFHVRFFGTAFMCDGSMLQAAQAGYIPIEYVESGDGSKCLSGNKVMGIKIVYVGKSVELQRKFEVEYSKILKKIIELENENEKYKSIERDGKIRLFTGLINLGTEIVKAVSGGSSSNISGK